MKLPQTAEYAFRALAYVAILPKGQAVRAADLSRATMVPVHYLSKVLRRLVNAGLLHGQKGHGGGFVLARPPDQIRFADILEATDAIPDDDHCAFGFGACDAGHPCPLHGVWSELKACNSGWASHFTLADVRSYSAKMAGADGPEKLLALGKRRTAR